MITRKCKTQCQSSCEWKINSEMSARGLCINAKFRKSLLRFKHAVRYDSILSAKL